MHRAPGGKRFGGAVVIAAMMTTACGSGSKGDPDADTTESVSVDVGPEGGTVEGPQGATAVIPPGALPDTVTIRISVASDGFAELPAVATSRVYSFEPHGLQFSLPVTIIIPHAENPADVALFTSSPGASWEKLAADRHPTDLSVDVEHFSFFFNGREVCGLYRQECCLPSEGQACAGDALTCIDNRCMACGFPGEPCCGDPSSGTCHTPGFMCISQSCQTPAGTPDASPPPLPDAAPGPACNPLTQTGCAGGQKCGLDRSALVFACQPPGLTPLGAACTVDPMLDDCAAGLHCLATGGICAELCEPTSAPCASGTCEPSEVGASDFPDVGACTPP